MPRLDGYNGYNLRTRSKRSMMDENSMNAAATPLPGIRRSLAMRSTPQTDVVQQPLRRSLVPSRSMSGRYVCLYMQSGMNTCIGHVYYGRVCACFCVKRA
jgi:hypothetical protein